MGKGKHNHRIARCCGSCKFVRSTRSDDQFCTNKDTKISNTVYWAVCSKWTLDPYKKDEPINAEYGPGI